MSARKLWAVCVCSLACYLPLHAQIFTGSLNVVTGNSNLAVITSSSNLNGPLGSTNYQQQAAGSLTTTYFGTVNVQVDLGANTVQFLNTTALTANNSGNWAPLAGGGTGNAPANYGVFIPYFFGSVNVNAALRTVSYSVTSANLSLTGGGSTRTFTPTQTFNITTGNLDYNATGGFTGSGTTTMVGTTTGNTTATLASLDILGGNQFQITFPVTMNIVIPFTTTAGDFTATTRFQGSLQAVGTLAAVPEPTTYALIGSAVSVVGYVTYRQKKRRSKV